MWRSRFFWQLFLGFVALDVVTTGVVGFLLSEQVEDDTLASTRSTLRRSALLLKEVALPYFTGSTDHAIQERVRATGEQIGVRLTIIANDGVVVADSLLDPRRMDNHAERPEVIAARRDGEGTITRLSDSLDEAMIYHAIVVEHDGQARGVARAALSLSLVEERLSQLRSRVVAGALVAAFVALVISFWLSRSVTRPLTLLTAAAQSIAQGNYEDRVEAKSKDEIGKLARAFNSMAEQLSERIASMTREENKVLTILSGMVEGVVAVDLRGHVLHMNDAARRILDAPESLTIAQGLFEVARLREVSELLRETLADGRDRRHELHLEPSGGERVIDAHASPLRDGDGRLVGGVVVLHDVTDLRRLETVRRDFVANVSHELKTPVTAIRGLVETLIDSADMDAETRTRFLDKVRNQALRLSSLVSDLLTLSRVQSRKAAHIEHERFDLREQVLDATRRAHVIAEEKGVELSSRVSRESIEILGDAEGLSTVVDNLLDNAIKYTPSGGTVTLRAHRDGVHAVIEVSDTGIGIGPEHQERVFERFYRVDKARSRELGGTGLGLSIVKNFVSAMGGAVRLESELGCGSTFRVEIPLAVGDRDAERD